MISETDVTFIIVPTPSREDGSFSSEYIEKSLFEVSKYLKSKRNFHLFSVVSTISPGTTSEILIPLVERISEKKVSRDFGLCYNPTFIALGSVIRDFLNPDLVLIGESDRASGEQLENIHRKLVENKPRFARMSPVSAEITKISLNSFITMKISFANTLAEICESLPGANIDDITKALGADKRISPHYLKGGLAYGGPCFPRDNRAFAEFSRRLGVEPELAEATDRTNKHQIERICKKVRSFTENGFKKASVLGLSYKSGTYCLDESASVKIIESLIENGTDLCIWDPIALPTAKELFGNKVRYAKDMTDCLLYSSIWIFATYCEEFESIEPSMIKNNPTIIFDSWRIFESHPIKNNPKVRYIATGLFNS